MTILIAVPASAQVKDTTIKHSYSEITFYTLAQPHTVFHFDSSLTDFHLYPFFRKDDPIAEAIGSTGLPVISPRYNRVRPLGVDAGFHVHDPYLYDHDKVPFHNPPFGFTSLEYVQGLGGEQQLHALHSQNIRGRVNFGADYRLLGSTGVYDHQVTRIDNLHLFTRYRTKSRRYGALVSYILNDVKNETNGGVTSNLSADPDSLFSLFPKSIASVRNVTANMRQNHKEVVLYQNLDFGKKYDVTLESDSVVQLFYPKLRFFHRLKWGEMTYSYDDILPDTNYYTNIFLSSDSTFDETHHVFFHNTVGIELPGIKSQTADTVIHSLLHGEAWVKHSLDEMSQLGNAFYYNNVWLGGLLSTYPTALPLDVEVGASGIISGPNAGDLYVTAIASRRIVPAWTIKARYDFRLQSPSFIHNFYIGNHHIWDVSHGREASTKVGLELAGPHGFLLRISYQDVIDLSYFDMNSEPVQSIANARVLSCEIQHVLRWKSLRFHNHVLLQSARSAHPPEVINVPTWTSRHALYFEGTVFKKALHLQAGIDVRFHSAYFAPYFDPVISQFLVQRSELTSSLPVTDIFVNMRIKKARIFLMVNDVTEGLMAPGGYFVVPGYPASGRTFRFGVSWQLFD